MKIYCDGGSRGNPGPGASAFVVYNGEGSLVFKDSRFLGKVTNNVAEYSALLMALKWASENATEDVDIILDSELVKKQMTGEYRIKNSVLQNMALSAKRLQSDCKFTVNFVHTPREGNPVADKLVNTTLDKHT